MKQRLRSAVIAFAIISLPVAGYFLFYLGENVNRCRSLAPRHARQRAAMREVVRRMRHDLESEKPQSLADVQKFFLGLPPAGCAKHEPAYAARWNAPVGRGEERQTVRIDVKVDGCANDSRVISFDVDEKAVDELPLEGCSPRPERD